MMRTFVVLLAALSLAPISLSAHEGHAHKTMGVVTMVHEKHVEVKDLKDQKTLFTVDAKTKISRGKLTVQAEEIKVGDRVVVTYQQVKDKAGNVSTVVKTIQLGVTAAPVKS
jgi:hypothetical protein